MKLYEEGFEKHDFLQRADIGKSLSDLVERIEDPIVVALDGGWGTGKTYFLKRWIGQHTLDDTRKATIVYFDAFERDYLTDPLPSLVSTLCKRFPHADKSTMQKIKNVTVKFAKPLTRAVLATATSGLSESLTSFGGAAVNAVSAEANRALEDYWSQENERDTVMEEFHTALEELINSQKEDELAYLGAKLVIVVDELDRCRPDYALEVLEVMKHFFAIPGIAFVLGVNLNALENSVKVRYGGDIDASAYLRKFINISLNLPSEVRQRQTFKDTALVYLDHQIKEMGIPDHIADTLKRHVEIVCRNNSVSIRDVGKILSAITLLSGEVLDDKNILLGWIEVLITLVVAKVVHPEMHDRFLSMTFTKDNLESYFDATPQRRTPRMDEKPNRNFNRYTMIQYYLWIYLARGRDSPDVGVKMEEMVVRLFSESYDHPDDPRSIPKKVNRDWIDLFKAEGI